MPCQDVSSAGRRAGIKDGTRSGLWAVFADAIDALRPPLVIIENVRGLLSATAHRAVESDESAMGNGAGRPVLRAIGAVLGDLSDLGYDARWATVAAASVGAPHRRERVFIVASLTDTAGEGRSRGIPETTTGLPGWCGDKPELLTTPQRRDWKGTNSNHGGPWKSLPRDIVELLPTPSAHDKTGARSPESIARMDKPFANLNDTVVNQLLPTPSASDGDPKGGPNNPENRLAQGHHVQLIDLGMRPDLWGKYAPAIYNWEQLTRSAPPATEPNKNGKPRLFAPFSEWLMGWPTGWVTEIDGLSRNDQLKICGNGVCPQQAEAALRYLMSVSTP